MRVRTIAAALILVCSTTGAAWGTSISAVQAPDSARLDEAAKLARLLNSEANIIGDAEDDRRALATANELIIGNAEFAALEKEFPGMGLEIAQAMLPITNRSMKERLPILWQRQTELYAANFNAAELTTLLEFYSSSTGIKLVNTLKRDMRYNKVLEEAKASPDFKFSADAVLADIDATKPQLMAQMDAGDQLVLLRFGVTKLPERIQKLAPAAQKLVIDWSNESASWEEAEIEKVVTRVIKARTKVKHKR